MKVKLKNISEKLGCVLTVADVLKMGLSKKLKMIFQK
jgi:hypothetical protein